MKAQRHCRECQYITGGGRDTPRFWAERGMNAKVGAAAVRG
jgi:hypothetical protein